MPYDEQDLPKYLTTFVNAPKPEKVRSVAKKIIKGTYDDKKELDWINTVIYKHMPSHKKSEFRSANLKNVPISVLEEHELKRKIKKEAF